VRILAVTHLFPTPGRPAFAPYNRQQFAELAKRHEVRIIRPIAWPEALSHKCRGSHRMSSFTTEQGIEVYTPTFFYPPLLLRHQYGLFFERSIASTARFLLQRFRPDVVLGSWAHPDGWAAVRLAKRAGLPVVLKVHGSDVLVLATGRRRLRVADALHAADAVVAVSHDLAANVVRMGVPADQVHVVPHGIDTGLFTPGDQTEARRRLRLSTGTKLILFVGNVLVSKGAADLVAACALLRNQGVAFNCHLIGRGRDVRAIAQLIRSHGLEKQVVLSGVRSHLELVDWYRACDVVALPSYSEGIPNVLREALACGKPFVATRVGGIPEIADATYSRLVSAGNTTELANALASMLASPLDVDGELVRRTNMTCVQSAYLLEEYLRFVVHARQMASVLHPSVATAVPHTSSEPEVQF
jgi:glycosyltransferase involved in cell wall biosynthesis